MNFKRAVINFEELLQQRNQREVWLFFATVATLLFFVSHKLLIPALDMRLSQIKQEHTSLNIHQNLQTQRANLASIALQITNSEARLNALIKQEATIQNQLNNKNITYLDSKNSSAFLDFIGKQTAKNSAILISIKPQPIIESISTPNRASFIVECNAGFKNLLYILNEIENSPFVTTIDSVHVYANGKNIFKVSLYGLSR